MRVAVLAVLVSMTQVTWAAAAESGKRDRRADDMREAIATLTAVIAAVAQPPSKVEDPTWLLKQSLKSGVVDPQAMGAIIRFFLYEKEEKVAGTLADALDEIAPTLQGPEGERNSGAARAVIGVFQHALRDAEHNRPNDGQQLLREAKPAIDAAVEALQQVQQRLELPPAQAAPAPAPAPATPDGPAQ